MRQPGGRFGWTGARSRAALLLAEDRLSDEAIAADVGVSRATLARWKEIAAFAERVTHLRQRLRDRLLEQGIADRQRRVLALNDRWHKMQQVLEARAIEHADMPGGSTGLLVREVKLVKVYFAPNNDDVDEELEPQPHGGALRRRHKAPESLRSIGQSVEVEEYAVDTGLLKELRAHEEQAARELGQWEDKRTVKLEVDKELERALDALGKALKPEEYARVLEALATGDTRAAAA